MGLIDTHTHLESFARQGTLAAALERAREAGVESLITIGTSTEDWELYRSLAAAFPGLIHYTAGLHPCEVDESWESEVAQLAGFWRSPLAVGADAGPAPVGLGECGLDRFHLPKEAAEADKVFALQRRAFDAQLALAKELGCPIVVHSRGAFAECVEHVDASGVEWSRVVFHCFTEGPVEIAELNRRGGVGSFTGILTYRNADTVRAAARAQSLDRFMVETDAPYLTPMPHRGKPNEPAFVRHTAEFAASEVFGIEYEAVTSAATANARRFFGLAD